MLIGGAKDKARRAFLKRLAAVSALALLRPTDAVSWTHGAGSVAGFPASGSSIDAKFDTNQVSGGTFANLFSISNNGGYAPNGDGTWTNFSSNVLKIISGSGLWLERATAQSATSPRLLSNAAWTKTNITVATTTGSDRSANAASRLTATATNATVSQAITLSPTFSVSWLGLQIKRITGTGNISISVDGGTTYYILDGTGQNITNCQRNLDSSWQHVMLPSFVNNPTIQLKISTNGDVVDVDFFGLEGANSSAAQFGNFATSPLATGTRNQDQLSVAGALLTLMQGSAGTLVIRGAGCGQYGSGYSSVISANNCYNGPPAGPSLSQTAGLLTFISDQTNNIVGPTAGSPNGGPVWVGGVNKAGPAWAGQDFNDPNFGTLNMPRPGVCGWDQPNCMGIAWSGSGFSVTMNGGTVQTSAQTLSFSASVQLALNYCGFITRVTAYNSRLSDAALQATCYIQPQLPTLVDEGLAGNQRYLTYTTDTGNGTEFPPSIVLPWNGNSAGSGLSPWSLSGGSNVFGTETGVWSEPYTYEDPHSTTWFHNAAFSYFPGVKEYTGLASGSMVRIAKIPGDPCGTGVDQTNVKERIEINNSFDTPGNWQTNGVTGWSSFSFFVVPGVPNLAHDFFTDQQWAGTHTGITMAIGISGYETFTISNGFQPPNDYNPSLIPFLLKHGVWYDVVTKILFQDTAIGTLDYWVGGVHVGGATGIKTFGVEGAGFWKCGVYRAPTSELRQIFYANIIIGTTSLNSKIASPDPIPSGFTFSNAPHFPH